jgi:tubulin polyglutamylase TTLL9
MQARGWEEVDVDDGTWDFIYADVGWIHENVHITYSARWLQRMRVCVRAK